MLRRDGESLAANTENVYSLQYIHFIQSIKFGWRCFSFVFVRIVLFAISVIRRNRAIRSIWIDSDCRMRVARCKQNIHKYASPVNAYCLECVFWFNFKVLTERRRFAECSLWISLFTGNCIFVYSVNVDGVTRKTHTYNSHCLNVLLLLFPICRLCTLVSYS